MTCHPHRRKGPQPAASAAPVARCKFSFCALPIAAALAGIIPAPALAGSEFDPAILAIKGDVEYGEYLSSECVTCHSADGEDRGIPSITGWPVDSFVVVMHSYKAKDRDHPAMRMIAGRLSNEEIAALAAFFATID